MNSESLIRDQLELILTITQQMLDLVRSKSDLKRFYELFAERTELFEKIDVSDQADCETEELIREILKLDGEIEDVLKILQAELVNEQIRVMHAKRTLGQKENRFESYIDFKK